MPIAPWAITNHEEFAELNLKHIPYHAWLREKQYRNANNPVTVEDPSYRTEIKLHEAGPALSSKENMSVTLERQVFRHVDYVEFDNPAVVDKFIEGWRQSGKQRCGYMLGRYVPDKDIPLGIRAVVSAIYEPPQNSTREGVQLLRDADDAAVDQLLEKLGGLRRIGFIWTSVSVDMQRKIVPDRDWDTVHLKSAECFRMGQFQNKYPSPSKESNTGVFGSKFVSVLVFGKEDGNIDLGAFQLSNQVCRLIRDGVVRTSKQPQSLHVRPSKDNVVHPDVFFREKNEYGFMVTKKAEPDFPNDYGLVSLRYGFPRDISPLFSRTLDFPIANRSPTVSAQQTPSSLKTLLQNQHGRSFLDKLNDFHVLLYIQKNVQRDLFDKILQAILSPNQGVNEQHIRPLLEAQLLNKAAPASQSQSTVSSSSSSSSSTSTPNQTSTANATAATPSQEMMEQLLLMGYGEDQAREALWATNNVSVEAALEFLLSRI
jgi:nuclear protein localization family protein 4